MNDASRSWRAQALVPRVATILIGAPVLIAAILSGGDLLSIVVLLLAALGAREFGWLAAAARFHPSPVLMAGALLLPAIAAVHRWDMAAGATVALVIASAAFALGPARRTGAPGTAAVDTFGALYVGLLFAHLILLRSRAGAEATLTIVGVIWANDIGAYLVGVRWGRRRLAPSISPGKSLEGFVGGLIVAVTIALAVAAAQGWPLVPVGAIALCAALAGVIGDLSKSTLKRAAGVKDSGNLLPGHGGILDRFDAVLFGVPVGYYLWGWLL